MSRSFVLHVAEPGQRLDRFLADTCGDLSRARLQRLIAQGHVTVDGAAARPSLRLRSGQAIAVVVPDPDPSDLVPQAIPLSVVYQDADVIVVDKPTGLTVHPAPGHPDHTLANAVLAMCPDIAGVGGQVRPGIVHRLDKDTSGLIVVAKNERAHALLSAQFKARQVAKGYLAMVRGRLEAPEAVIEAPIGRDPANRKRMAVVERGREARTPYRVLARPAGHTLVYATPTTGRTHQIRVHFAAVGHPLAGDRTYGGGDPRLDRHFLHAHLLGFRLPGTGEYRDFFSPLPPDLAAFVERIGGQVPAEAVAGVQNPSTRR